MERRRVAPIELDKIGKGGKGDVADGNEPDPATVLLMAQHK